MENNQTKDNINFWQFVSLPYLKNIQCDSQLSQSTLPACVFILLYLRCLPKRLEETIQLVKSVPNGYFGFLANLPRGHKDLVLL